jgi:hypothetical protein
MPTYHVHVYREMRVKFNGIEAESPEKAASVASGRCTEQADEVEDCQGMDLSALVDLQGDEEFTESRVVDFRDLKRLAASKEMLTALEEALAALNTVPRFKVPSLDTDSYKVAALCDRAIAKAKGGAK